MNENNVKLLELKLFKNLTKNINNVYTINKGEYAMEAKLQKWGNSDVIRIPKQILKSLDLNTNDKVNLIQEDDKIIITKVKDSKISLRERINSYSGENLSQEFSWDDPKGRELW